MKLIALIFTVFSFTLAFSSNKSDDLKSTATSITGKVVDSSEGLAGVKVLLDNKEIDVYTDFDGNFVIENVPAGEHVVSFTLVAYSKKEIIFNSKTKPILNVKLWAK